MILGLVVDGDGRPICTGVAGNTADVTSLLPVVDRLRERFPSAGSASSPTVADLGGDHADSRSAARYILGARERSDAIVRRSCSRTTILSSPYSRAQAGRPELFNKQNMEGNRYASATRGG